ncbi:MAG: hypothetical protein LLG09_02520 [Negativicutes bacterium]|nr:hypothetical protein [Negativicutes bacterium]
MSTVLFFANTEVLAMEGRFLRDQVTVNKICRTELAEGVLINGVILNEAAVAVALKQFFKDNHLGKKRVQLVIDSTQFQIKNVTLPQIKEKQLLALVQNEFTGLDRYQEPIFDYMYLQASANNRKMIDLLACVCERSYIKSYVELFESIEIQLVSINTALGSLLKLIELLPLFRERTCVLLVFSGENLFSILIQNGAYKYSSRIRLFVERGTPEFATAITRALSSIQQFQISNESGFIITDTYFCGCSQADVAVCQEGLHALQLSAQLLPESEAVVFPAEEPNRRLSDYVYLAGDFIRR